MRRRMSVIVVAAVSSCYPLVLLWLQLRLLRWNTCKLSEKSGQKNNYSFPVSCCCGLYFSLSIHRMNCWSSRDFSNNSNLWERYPHNHHNSHPLPPHNHNSHPLPPHNQQSEQPNSLQWWQSQSQRRISKTRAVCLRRT